MTAIESRRRMRSKMRWREGIGKICQPLYNDGT